MDSSLDDLDFDTFLSLHRSPIKRTDTTDREAIESASQRIARRREERKKAELEAIRAAAIERNKRDDAERKRPPLPPKPSPPPVQDDVLRSQGWTLQMPDLPALPTLLPSLNVPATDAPPVPPPPQPNQPEALPPSETSAPRKEWWQQAFEVGAQFASSAVHAIAATEPASSQISAPEAAHAASAAVLDPASASHFTQEATAEPPATAAAARVSQPSHPMQGGQRIEAPRAGASTTFTAEARLLAAQRGWRTRRALRSRTALELRDQLHDVRAMLHEMSSTAPAASSAPRESDSATAAFEATMRSGLRGQIRKQVSDLVALCARPVPPPRQPGRAATASSTNSRKTHGSVSFGETAAAARKPSASSCSTTTNRRSFSSSAASTASSATATSSSSVRSTSSKLSLVSGASEASMPAASSSVVASSSLLRSSRAAMPADKKEAAAASAGVISFDSWQAASQRFPKATTASAAANSAAPPTTKTTTSESQDNGGIDSPVPRVSSLAYTPFQDAARSNAVRAVDAVPLPLQDSSATYAAPEAAPMPAPPVEESQESKAAAAPNAMKATTTTTTRTFLKRKTFNLQPKPVDFSKVQSRVSSQPRSVQSHTRPPSAAATRQQATVSSGSAAATQQRGGTGLKIAAGGATTARRPGTLGGAAPKGKASWGATTSSAGPLPTGHPMASRAGDAHRRVLEQRRGTLAPSQQTHQASRGAFISGNLASTAGGNVSARGDVSAPATRRVEAGYAARGRASQAQQPQAPHPAAAAATASAFCAPPTTATSSLGGAGAPAGLSCSLSEWTYLTEAASPRWVLEDEEENEEEMVMTGGVGAARELAAKGRPAVEAEAKGRPAVEAEAKGRFASDFEALEAAAREAEAAEVEAAYSMACEEMAAKAAAMIAEAEAAEAEQPAVRSPEAVLAEEALVEAREAASLSGIMRQEALRLCDESDSAHEEEEEEEEAGDEDGAADHDEWACFADSITSPSVPVFSVGVDDLERPEAQVGATAPACDARPQAVQSVEIPEDEPISSYTDDSEDPESSLDPEYAAWTSSTQLDAALAQQVGVDTEAIFGEAGASGLVRGGGGLNHLAAIRQALAPRPGTFGNAPADSSTDVAARRPPSKNGPALAAQICREVREAEAEAELEFLSPAARLDAARKEQESSQTRAARQWESELARAERRASLPMVTLLRDVEGDDADAVDKGANEEGGDAELGGGRGPAGGAAAVTPSAASARSRVSRCVHSGRTWTWDSRKTDEPIAPADDRVEIPDDMHEEEEEERVESAYVDLSAGEAEPRSAHAAFATSAATAHATPADAATSAAARAWLERGSSLQILQSLPQSPGEPAAGRAPHAPMPPAPPPAVTKAAAEVSRFAALARPSAAPTKRTPPWRAADSRRSREAASTEAECKASAASAPAMGRSALTDLLQAAELGGDSPIPDILKGLSDRLKTQQQQQQQ